MDAKSKRNENVFVYGLNLKEQGVGEEIKINFNALKVILSHVFPISFFSCMV